jgi:glutamyl/glutaminyl-tRNA synthetase
MKKLIEKFQMLEKPAKEDYENALKETAIELRVGNRQLIHPLRLAVSGMGAGPGVFDIVDIIGKEETIKRINKAIEAIPVTTNKS